MGDAHGVILSGLEPETYCLEGSCSIQLSYRTWIIVGVARFELATSCSQSRRDNRATLHPELTHYLFENLSVFICDPFGASRYQLAMLRFIGINFSPFTTFKLCDPAGARTQDPNIKSVMLYQLSYGIIAVLTCFFLNHCRNWTANLSY